MANLKVMIPLSETSDKAQVLRKALKVASESLATFDGKVSAFVAILKNENCLFVDPLGNVCAKFVCNLTLTREDKEIIKAFLERAIKLKLLSKPPKEQGESNISWLVPVLLGMIQPLSTDNLKILHSMKDHKTFNKAGLIDWFHLLEQHKDNLCCYEDMSKEISTHKNKYLVEFTIEA